MTFQAYVGVFIIPLVLLGCNHQRAATGEGHEPITSKKIEAAFDANFTTRNASFFDKQEACFLRTSVLHEFDSVAQSVFVSIGGTRIYHGECDHVGVSYAVLQGTNDLNPFFYGHYDIYELTFSDTSTLGSIIRFENEELNHLLNHFIQVDDSTRAIQGYKGFYNLKTYLGQIYQYKSGYFYNVHRPIFEKYMGQQEFVDTYRNAKNALAFDKTFDENFFNRAFLFEVKYFGAVVFKYSFLKDSQFKLEEYLLPKIDRPHQFLNDGIPDYFDECR